MSSPENVPVINNGTSTTSEEGSTPKISNFFQLTMAITRRKSEELGATPTLNALHRQNVNQQSTRDKNKNTREKIRRALLAAAAKRQQEQQHDNGDTGETIKTPNSATPMPGGGTPVLATASADIQPSSTPTRRLPPQLSNKLLHSILQEPVEDLENVTNKLDNLCTTDIDKDLQKGQSQSAQSLSPALLRPPPRSRSATTTEELQKGGNVKNVVVPSSKTTTLERSGSTSKLPSVPDPQTQAAAQKILAAFRKKKEEQKRRAEMGGERKPSISLYDLIQKLKAEKPSGGHSKTSPEVDLKEDNKVKKQECQKQESAETATAKNDSTNSLVPREHSIPDTPVVTVTHPTPEHTPDIGSPPVLSSSKGGVTNNHKIISTAKSSSNSEPDQTSVTTTTSSNKSKTSVFKLIQKKVANKESATEAAKSESEQVPVIEVKNHSNERDNEYSTLSERSSMHNKNADPPGLEHISSSVSNATDSVNFTVSNVSLTTIHSTKDALKVDRKSETRNHSTTKRSVIENNPSDDFIRFASNQQESQIIEISGQRYAIIQKQDGSPMLIPIHSDNSKDSSSKIKSDAEVQLSDTVNLKQVHSDSTPTVEPLPTSLSISTSSMLPVNTDLPGVSYGGSHTVNIGTKPVNIEIPEQLQVNHKFSTVPVTSPSGLHYVTAPTSNALYNQHLLNAGNRNQYSQHFPIVSDQEQLYYAAIQQQLNGPFSFLPQSPVSPARNANTVYPYSNISPFGVPVNPVYFTRNDGQLTTGNDLSPNSRSAGYNSLSENSSNELMSRDILKGREQDQQSYPTVVNSPNDNFPVSRAENSFFAAYDRNEIEISKRSGINKPAHSSETERSNKNDTQDVSIDEIEISRRLLGEVDEKIDHDDLSMNRQMESSIKKQANDPTPYFHEESKYRAYLVKGKDTPSPANRSLDVRLENTKQVHSIESNSLNSNEQRQLEDSNPVQSERENRSGSARYNQRNSRLSSKLRHISDNNSPITMSHEMYGDMDNSKPNNFMPSTHFQENRSPTISVLELSDPSSLEEREMLSRLASMIRQEFAYDGYLENGIEELAMAEYIMSLTGMNRSAFKEAVADQYCDLYWDEELLNEMYRVIDRGKTSNTRMKPMGQAKIIHKPSNDYAAVGNYVPSLSTSSVVVGKSAVTPFREVNIDRPNDNFDNLVHITRKLPDKVTVDDPLLKPVESIQPTDTKSRGKANDDIDTGSDVSGIAILKKKLRRNSSIYMSKEELHNDIQPILDYNRRIVDSSKNKTLEELKRNIVQKLIDVDQQIKVEKMMKVKTLKYLSRLQDVDGKQRISPTKGRLARTKKNLIDMEKRMSFLVAAKQQLEEIDAERWGLDSSLLFSLANCDGNQPLSFRVTPKNPTLIFGGSWDMISPNMLSSSTGSTPVLQTGTRRGLLSFLYARDAKGQDYVNDFLLTFRYIMTPLQLYQFITNVYTSATCVIETGGTQTYQQVQVQFRSLDILYEWIEGYYAKDFRTNQKLENNLIDFMENTVIPIDATGMGVRVLYLCNDKKLSTNERDQTENTIIREQQIDKEEDDIETNSSSNRTLGSTPSNWRMSVRRSNSTAMGMRELKCFDDVPSAISITAMDRGKNFHDSLLNYSTPQIAKQLTLMQQELFLGMHPIDFLGTEASDLNSSVGKFNRFGSVVNFRASIGKPKHELESFNYMTSERRSMREKTSLKNIAKLEPSEYLEILLERAQGASIWIAGELCGCPSAKMQLTLLTEFIKIAKWCYEKRNYATFLQVVEGLEMIVVRQLPVWRSLPAKALNTMEHLSSYKLKLQTDTLTVILDSVNVTEPTLPPVSLFLSAIQQHERDGFLMPNGMYKWSKMRTIARIINQVRIFKANPYTFPADMDLQRLISKRMVEFQDQDLQELVAQNHNNFPRSALQRSSQRFRKSLQRVKYTFQRSN
ncbi:Protein very KIND [Trichoplax sp. H2]|nr:Protein very KIND [Trichoplax sp. H2]|eukprot:RDD38827.1 Protein very KIND [Trichoplax sp. H2]